MEKQRIRYNIIAYLRIFACMLIIRGHYYSIYSMPTILGKFIITGTGPVTIFFVISGFLAYISFDNQITIKQYYMRRIKKIVPPYYIILIACIIFLTCTNGIVYDSMKIGWLRYFSFLNMLMPSFSFDEWNNLYGFWTMGCFPFFYFIAPYLYRKMQSFKSSVIAFTISISGMLIGRGVILFFWQRMGYDGMNAFLNMSPISTLYLFVMGMMSAFAYKQNCIGKMAMFFGIFLLAMLAFGKSGFVLWGVAISIILLVPSINLQIEKNKIWNMIVCFLDRNSFNMYLLHLLVSDVCVYTMKSTGFLTCIISFVIVLVLSELLSQLLKCFSGVLS